MKRFTPALILLASILPSALQASEPLALKVGDVVQLKEGDGTLGAVTKVLKEANTVEVGWEDYYNFATQYSPESLVLADIPKQDEVVLVDSLPKVKTPTLAVIINSTDRFGRTEYHRLVHGLDDRSCYVSAGHKWHENYQCKYLKKCWRRVEKHSGFAEGDFVLFEGNLKVIRFLFKNGMALIHNPNDSIEPSYEKSPYTLVTLDKLVAGSPSPELKINAGVRHKTFSYGLVVQTFEAQGKAAFSQFSASAKKPIYYLVELTNLKAPKKELKALKLFLGSGVLAQDTLGANSIRGTVVGIFPGKWPSADDGTVVVQWQQKFSGRAHAISFYKASELDSGNIKGPVLHLQSAIVKRASIVAGS